MATNLEIKQGETFSGLLRIKENPTTTTDVTGYTFRGQARRKIADPEILFSFSFVIQDQLTNEGEVLWLLADSITTGIALDGKVLECFYDIEMVDTASNVTRIVEGKIKITPEVTR
jgi:hypothetical protein